MRPLFFWYAHQHTEQCPVGITMPNDQNGPTHFMGKNVSQRVLYSFCEINESFSAWNAMETLVLLAGFPQGFSFCVPFVTEAAF